MTHLLVESSRELPLVAIAVSFRCGAVHEPTALQGLARVTARMLRRGAEGWGERQLEEHIDALGGDLAMHVGLGSTTVSFEVATRFAEPAAALLATILGAPTFEEVELDKLVRQSVAEIVSSRDEDALLAARALRRHLLGNHPHARRISGTMEALSRIDRRSVVDFHRECYTRANAIVGIAGDADDAQAEAIAARLLERLPEGRVHTYDVPEPSVPRGRGLVIVDKPERTQVQLGIGGLGTHPLDADHTALVVANTAFGGTFSSRLTQEVRVKRGWSYGAHSGFLVSRVRELFSLWSAPAVDDAADCLALEIAMLEEWQRDGVTSEELERAKQYLRRSFAFEIDTPRKRLHQSLERALLGLPDDYHSGFVQRVGAVSIEQANAAVRARLDLDALWVSALATAPQVEERLCKALPRLSQHVVEPFDLE